MLLQARHKTGLVFFPAFDWAISPTHPEREERLLYTQDQVFEEGILDINGIEELKPEMVDIRDIQRVHFCVPNPRTVMTESHFISAGGAKTIGAAVLEKRIRRGFAMVRPPGHHAHRVVHGARGFCNVNTEATMIESLRSTYGIRKIAIVDTDCHHGDGTQDIYWHDPDTLFISMHQDGRTLFPGSGFPDEMGGPNALGTTVNIPLPPYTSEAGFLYTLENCIMPILNDFQPELVINSAGQDNHFSDPITNMNLSAKGYADLTTILKPDIAVLEGGYAIEGALPYVNTGIILAMAGVDYSHLREPDYDHEKIRQNEEITHWVEQICDHVLENWRQRSKLRVKLLAQNGCNERLRRIYYDTDHIHEHQEERVEICDTCAGALRIDSLSSKGDQALCIHIPLHACAECRRTAENWYDMADPEKYNYIFLQNRPNDSFHEKQRNRS